MDDNEDTRFMLSALLGRDYDTEMVGGIAEAIEAAGRERFDLYVLDNIFPDGTGTELCRRLRELHPRTPVIFYSGAACESDREESLRAGAREYVAKPGIDRLSEAVRGALDGGTQTVTEAD